VINVQAGEQGEAIGGGLRRRRWRRSDRKTPEDGKQRYKTAVKGIALLGSPRLDIVGTYPRGRRFIKRSRRGTLPGETLRERPETLPEEEKNKEKKKTEEEEVDI